MMIEGATIQTGLGVCSLTTCMGQSLICCNMITNSVTCARTTRLLQLFIARVDILLKITSLALYVSSFVHCALFNAVGFMSLAIVHVHSSCMTKQDFTSADCEVLALHFVHTRVCSDFMAACTTWLARLMPSNKVKLLFSLRHLGIDTIESICLTSVIICRPLEAANGCLYQCVVWLACIWDTAYRAIGMALQFIICISAMYRSLSQKTDNIWEKPVRVWRHILLSHSIECWNGLTKQT